MMHSDLIVKLQGTSLAQLRQWCISLVRLNMRRIVSGGRDSRAVARSLYSPAGQPKATPYGCFPPVQSAGFCRAQETGQ